VRIKGETKFGNRKEIKNLNSIRNVQRAIEKEISKLIESEELKSQNQIGISGYGSTWNSGVHGYKNSEPQQQHPLYGYSGYSGTNRYDAVTNETSEMRTKEMANDYRYFPEPDLPPVIIREDYINKVREKLPQLPDTLFKKYVSDYKLSSYDAGVLTDTKEVSDYFNELIKHTNNYKAAANMVMGPIKSYLNEMAVEMLDFPVSVERMAQLITLIEDGKVSHSVGVQKIFPEMVSNAEKNPLMIAESLNLLQESNDDALNDFIQQAIAKYPEKVIEYKAGKAGLFGLFMGEVMKLSKGKADPKVANKLLVEALNKSKLN
jgi:aspartyl-tRNA(Asn)/glutamyl-tRNA(Gln) amidotransferase subunit B